MHNNRYCTFYLKGIECPNKECLFLHKMADEADIISREDLNSNKNIFLEQQLYAMKIADIYNSEVKKRLSQGKPLKFIFPAPETLYNKDLVKEMDPVYQKRVVKKQRYYDEDKAACGNGVGLTYPAATTTNNKINTIQIEPKALTKESKIETTSTSSKDDIPVNDGDVANNIVFKAIHNIFSIKERSRFDFVGTSKEEIEVPKFIKDLIVKKVSRHKLTKNIKNSEDILYSDNNLELEYKNNNSWAQFIIENKTVNDDWEFIQDFDYINSIIDKRK
jgi:hypothetical protein